MVEPKKTSREGRSETVKTKTSDKGIEKRNKRKERKGKRKINEGEEEGQLVTNARDDFLRVKNREKEETSSLSHPSLSPD